MKTRKTFLTAVAFFLLGATAYAQEARVGINTIDPKTTLDVSGKTDTSGNLLTTDMTGLQAPRLTRAELTAKGNTLYTTDQKGALIYITDISGGDTTSQRGNVTAVGYYYFDGSDWQKLSGGGATYTAGTSMNLSGTEFQRAALTGDVTAAVNSNATTVVKIQGRDVATTAPTDGQILTWDNTASTWKPATPGSGADNWGTQVAQVQGVLAGDGTTASKLDVQGTNGGVLYGTGAGTSSLFTAAGTSGQILKSNGAAAPTWVDPNSALTKKDIVTGTSSSSATAPLVLSGNTGQVVGATDATLTVNNTAALWNANQLQGKDITTTAPTDGQLLRYNGTTSKWEPYTVTLPTAPSIVFKDSTYTVSAAADISSSVNTIVFTGSAPPNFTLSDMTAADVGKILYFYNATAQNVTASFNRAGDHAAATLSILGTRGYSLQWTMNGSIGGWARMSY